MIESIYRQVDGGRWIWEVRGALNIFGDDLLSASAVSFPTKAAAEDQHRIHDFALTDGTAHRLLTRADLMQLLMHAADMCEGCVFAGNIVRSMPTATGCNWAIEWNGANRRCKQLMWNAVTNLRRQYNLLDE